MPTSLSVQSTSVSAVTLSPRMRLTSAARYCCWPIVVVNNNNTKRAIQGCVLSPLCKFGLVLSMFVYHLLVTAMALLGTAAGQSSHHPHTHTASAPRWSVLSSCVQAQPHPHPQPQPLILILSLSLSSSSSASASATSSAPSMHSPLPWHQACITRRTR